MGAIAAGLSMLLAKVGAALGWVGRLVVAVFVSVWDLLKDAFCWVFEQVLAVATAAVGAVDVSAVSAASGWWGMVPADVLNILGLIGLGQALGVVFAAILIRVTLQLIPFVRLGS